MGKPLLLRPRAAEGPLAVLPCRCSYAAVLVASGVGVAFPAAAGWLLAPALAVGLVVLGLAHGACDQLVVPAERPALARRRRYWAGFLLAYLGLAGAVVALWWQLPASAALFFLLTAWHWGSADVPAAARRPGRWVAHSLLRGGLLFAVPALRWPAETLGIVNGLLGFTGAQPLAAGAFGAAGTALGLLVGTGHLLLWGGWAVRGRWPALRRDGQEAALLTGLLGALPPVLAVGVYFVFWHSLQHVLRLVPLLGYASRADSERAGSALWRQLGFFLRRALPLLLLSGAALLGLRAGRPPDDGRGLV